MESEADLLLNLIQIDQQLKGTDLVISGESKLMIITF